MGHTPSVNGCISRMLFLSGGTFCVGTHTASLNLALWRIDVLVDLDEQCSRDRNAKSS